MSIRKAAALATARILSRSAQEDASKPLRQLVRSARAPGGLIKGTVLWPGNRKFWKPLPCCQGASTAECRALAATPGRQQRECTFADATN